MLLHLSCLVSDDTDGDQRITASLKQTDELMSFLHDKHIKRRVHSKKVSFFNRINQTGRASGVENVTDVQKQ